jgi:aerobic C4-dicarboxylate transport protein
MALLLGVERFMSEGRAVMTLVGNAVATVVVARWDGAADMARVRRELGQGPAAAAPSSPAAEVERT